MPTSEAFANSLLDHVLGGPDFTRPATVYIGLFRSDNQNELSGDGYERVAVTNNATNFPGASEREKENGTTIEFSSPSADWPEVGEAGIFTEETGGTAILRGDLTVARTFLEGDTPRFNAGAIAWNLDKEE